MKMCCGKTIEKAEHVTPADSHVFLFYSSGMFFIDQNATGLEIGQCMRRRTQIVRFWQRQMTRTLLKTDIMTR